MAEGRPGRPTIKTPAIIDEIIDRIGSGEYVAKICRDEHMPDRSIVFRWLCSDDDFATRYARAKLAQADVIEDDIAQTEDDALMGAVDPNAARVALQSKQWRASRLSPRKYGDRQILAGDKSSPIQIEQKSDYSKLSIEELRMLMALAEKAAVDQD